MSTIDMEYDHAGVSVLVLQGEHDLSTMPDIDERIGSALRDSEGVVVDLSGTSFVDSAVLRVLITSQAAAEERGIGFVVVVPDSSVHGVHRLLNLTGLAERLHTAPSRESAVAAARPAT